MQTHKINIYQLLLWLSIFGIAMGFLEGIVVVYLRKIYFPEGFGFPLTKMTTNAFLLEVIREICTIIMLLAISSLSGKNRSGRILNFLSTFAIWDISYYIALKSFLNWPESLLTYDVLFLIPYPWISPVVAPVMCSALMLAMSIQLMCIFKQHPSFKLLISERLLIIAGTILILISFLWDYTILIINAPNHNGNILEISSTYVPEKFQWIIFISGFLMVIISFLLIIIRKKQQ